MPIASGIAKQVRYKVESTWGVAPGAAGGQLLRRVESSIDIEKETYQSGELRSDYQIADFRHGTRKSSGAIKGELSPKTYADFIAAALRRDFTAGVQATGASITIAGSGPYTLTRAAGSYLTDGFKIGDVIRLTAGAFNAANLNKNAMITALTATVATVVVLNGSTLTAEGPIASATVAVTGKKTYTPITGHTDKSFAVEHWFADIAQSELYAGLKVSGLSIGLPPSGMASIDLDFLGGGSLINNTAAYYSAPAALTNTGILTAVNGVLYVGGVAVTTCTGVSFKVDGGYSSEAVVGSNTSPAVFPGRVAVTGQFTAYFESATFRDQFLNETEVGLSVVLTADNAANADFVGFTLSRIKLGSAKRSDGEKGLIVTCDFQALINTAGGAGTANEQTTISVQDSAA